MIEWGCDFSLAPSASLATWELLCCSDSLACSSDRCSIVGVVAVGGVVMLIFDDWGRLSLDRETCRPALAMELKLDSGLEDCLRKATESEGLEAAVLDAPERGLVIATGSLFDCINAAMDNGWFFPPCSEGW